MTVWAKRLDDGTISIGTAVTTSDWTLTEGSEPRDGWTEHVDTAAALTALTPPDSLTAAANALAGAQSLEEARQAGALMVAALTTSEAQP